MRLPFTMTSTRANLAKAGQNTFSVSNAMPALLLVAVVAGYMLLTFNRYLPIQEGWFMYYSQLMDQGRFPYRDFYIHVQPIYLCLVSGLTKLFGMEFIVLRAYGIFERCLLCLLLYFYLIKYFPPVNSFFCAIFGIFIYSSFNVDLPYSYYQTSLLFTFLSAIFFFRALDIGDNLSLSGHISLVFSGIFSSLSFFTKQSAGMLFLILYFSIIIIYYLRLVGLKATMKNLFSFCFGFLIVTSIVIVWLNYNHALSDYLNIVFGATSSKGNPTDIMFGFLHILFTMPHSLRNSVLIALISILILYLVARKENLLSLSMNNERSDRLSVLFLSLGLVSVYVLSYLALPINLTGILARIQHIILLITFSGTIFLIPLFFYRWMKDAHDRLNNYYLFSALIALTLMYAHGMSGVLEVPSLLLALPFLMLFVLEKLNNAPAGNVFKLGLIFIGFLCVFIIAADRYHRPYYWWGWGEPDVRTAEYSSDIPGLHGMYLSQSTKEIYEYIYNLIHDNTCAGDELFAFPHIALFNVITRRTNSNFTPVTYFDVCSDKYAIKTAQYIVERNPKLIVIMEFPEYAWRKHETIFRGGKKSSQRQIVESIKIMKAQGLYKTIGRVESYGNYPIEILKRDY